MPSRGTFWDAAVGVAAALLIFGAVPAVLGAFVGVPLPHDWSGRALLNAHGLFDLLAIVSWGAWAACAWPILRSLTSRLRARDLGAPTRLADRLALRIALGILALGTILGIGAPLAGAAPLQRPAAAAAHQEPATAVRSPTATQSSWWTVGPGDSLAGIASAVYGDPGAWPAVASVNLGRVLRDGERFVDPGALSPGWRLRLPPLDAATGPARVTTGAVPPVEGGAVVVPGADLVLPLAELAAAGLSALVAGLLARRARQLRRLEAFLRAEGEASGVPADPEADLGTLVAPFEQLPLLDMVEAAAIHLADALPAPSAHEPPSPRVQWLRAGRDGVEIGFAAPGPQPPAPWRRAAPSTWLLPAAVDLSALARTGSHDGPWCRVLLPLGDDERGTWLLPVEPGTCVSVVGARAPELVRAMRVAASTWSWHESIVVTDDPTAAQAATRAGGRRQPAGVTVLFVGDPGVLERDCKEACAVLATGAVDEAAVTVVVDARGASAHPLGLTVRPPLVGPQWSSAVDALSRGRGDGRHDRADPPADRHVVPLVRRDAAPVALRLVEVTDGARAGTPQGPSARGQAEVRLLAPVPDLVGLSADLPPNRARRAVELVAYLALHAPDPVTSDRLRTRVLGSADADAAAKTLFNTVVAARQALGTGPAGEPLLPRASRSGHYRISPWVTVDARRACSLLREGLTTRDPAEARARLQEGLELLRGEPLGGVLTGYGWWRAEGHERRLADAVVDGACALVRSALASDDIDLARWALVQARTVEPYCEALTRAAMRVAAASGDARRLHEEWRECLRQVDELDPGGTPSTRTGQLYALLRAQLCGAPDGGRATQASLAAIEAAPLSTVPSAPSTV